MSELRPITGDIPVNTLKAVSGYTNVAALKDGGFVAIWDNGNIAGQRFDASGNKVGNEFQANTQSLGRQDAPDITSLSNGGFVVTWFSTVEEGDRQGGVYGQLFDSTGAMVGTEFHVNSYIQGFQGAATVTELKNGNFIIAWASERGSGLDTKPNISGQVFNSAGSKLGGELVLNSTTEANQIGPSIAALPDGGFVLTWQREVRLEPPSRSWEIFAQRFDSAGESIGSEFQVNTFVQTSQTAANVAVLKDGGFVVTWTSSRQDDTSSVGFTQDGVYAQRYDAGGNRVGGEFRVNSQTLGDQQSSSVAALNDGGFLVTYQSNGGVHGFSGSSEVWVAQRFDSSGNPVGAELVLSQQGANDLRASQGLHDNTTIAVLENGNIVTTWYGWHLETRDNRAVAKIFSAEPTATDGLVPAFQSNADTAKALSAAYELLLGGVPNAAGYTFLINGAVSTNFGAGPGPVFNTENIYINLFNNLVQGNPAAKARFDAIATGTTLTEKITSIYQALVPPSKQTAEGLAFIARPDGIAFYQSVAAERGVAGTDGAAIIAMASLMQIAVNGDFGIGNAVNDLLKAVAAGSAAIPASGSVLTAIETADGTAFDADDAAALARTVDPAPYSYVSEVDGGVNDLSGTTDIALIGIGLIDA